MTMMFDDEKRLAAEAAASEVCDGMLVGLGTGSTAAFVIRALAGRPIDCVATSEASAELARMVGLRVRDFAAVSHVDLTIDGVDEIAPDFTAIKGAGGAMVREKIVATASARMIVVADGRKRVAALGGAALPIEVLPFALGVVRHALGQMFEHVDLRGGAAPYRTDNGNLVLDCRRRQVERWETIANALDVLPGVIGHGLFLTQIAAAYIAADGVVTHLERDRPSD